MKQKWMALILAAALLSQAPQGLTLPKKRLGCRVWADDVLIYEGTGQNSEDSIISLDPSGNRQLRVEYSAEWKGEIWEFPDVNLNFAQS